MQAEFASRDMKHYLIKLNNSLSDLLWPILVFFTPIKGILITVGAFIILDTITGLWKARVTDTPITSKGLSAVISKMLLYQACILTVYLLDVFVLGDILQKVFGIEGLLTKVAALLLVFIESKSINENYEEAKGIDLWEEFKNMLSRGKEVTSGMSGMGQDLKGIPKSKPKNLLKEKDLDDIFK